jgi:hypothetical protein
MEKDYLILKTQVPQFRTGLLVRAGTVLACSRLSLSGALQKSGGTIEGDHGEPQARVAQPGAPLLKGRDQQGTRNFLHITARPRLASVFARQAWIGARSPVTR